MPECWTGSIENVLQSGEYDQGDQCLVDYDELCDLIEQIKLVVGDTEEMISQREIERRTNRPLHPCLGGKSPYSEFLPL